MQGNKFNLVEYNRLEIRLVYTLTMCIAANVKQVLMIGMSTVLFQTEVQILNGFGILLVLLGGALYSYVCFIENCKKKMNNNNDKNAQVVESKV